MAHSAKFVEAYGGTTSKNDYDVVPDYTPYPQAPDIRGYEPQPYAPPLYDTLPPPPPCDIPYGLEITQAEVDSDVSSILSSVKYFIGMNRVRCDMCRAVVMYNNPNDRFFVCGKCRSWNVRPHVSKPATSGTKYIRCCCRGLFLCPIDAQAYICPRENVMYIVD